MLFWAGIFRHKLLANQVVRCFKRKLKIIWGISWFFASIEATKKYVRRMANQFGEFFTFGFFDLLVLIPVVYSSVILINLPHFSTAIMKMWLLVFKFRLYYEANSSDLINSNSPLNLRKCYGFVMISGWIEVIFA